MLDIERFFLYNGLCTKTLVRRTEMQEKIEHSTLDTNLSTVIKMLLYGAYDEARVLFERYLVANELDEESAIIKIAIMIRDNRFYLWFSQNQRFEEKTLVTSLYSDLVFSSKEVCGLIAQFPSLREKIVVYLDDVIGSHFKLFYTDEQDKSISRICIWRILKAYCPFLKELPMETILQRNDIRMADFLLYEKTTGKMLNDGILYRYCSRLLDLDQKLYTEQVCEIANCMFMQRDFERARMYYEDVLPLVPEEQKHMIQFNILCAKLEVVGDEEFMKSDNFSYELEEYIQLLLFVQDYPVEVKRYTELARLTEEKKLLRKFEEMKKLQEEECEREKKLQEEINRKQEERRKAKKKKLKLVLAIGIPVVLISIGLLVTKIFGII